MKISREIYKRIVAGKIFIDRNFNQPIGLDAISRHSCLSRFYFHRVFTYIYRKTPHRYLMEKRIESAKQMLSANELTVEEVCNTVGYESIGSFSILFKKEIGFAPQYYRNLAHERQQQAKNQPKSFIPHCYIEIYHLDK